MNAGFSWGTLGRESLGGQRRVRTLGLGAAVRACNEAAVPGTGGLWYAKQILFSALGVRLAAERRASNIRMANTIEALACLLGFSQSNAQDARLRGRRKIAGCSPDAPFKTVSKPSFYVTQPMRMGMAQPLISLGFALGEGGSSRFNALQLLDIGHDFVNEALIDFRPYNRTVADHLLKWIDGETDNNNTAALRRALSPRSPLPKRAGAILMEQMIKGEGARRRKNAMAWVRNPQRSNEWNARPTEIEQAHWTDLDGGARFFAMRDAASTCLDAVEVQMAGQGMFTLSFLDAANCEKVKAALKDAKRAADHFLGLNHLPDGAQDAKPFAKMLANDNLASTIQFLVEHDGRILARTPEGIVRGSAFDSTMRDDQPRSAGEDDDNGDAAATIPLPNSISGRVSNLALLCLDLDGKLDGWLNGGSVPSDRESE
jgi:hypothetical protein